MTEEEQLESGAAEIGVPLTADVRDRLLAFATLLRKWNRAFNLVSRNDVGRIVSRHLLDSLTLAPMLHGHRILDVGTGAGLPGMPLAILRPEDAFTLLDRSERRIRFVGQAVIELGLRNVESVVDDYASFRPKFLFDTVVSRAVAKPEVLWRRVSGLLAVGGEALFQIGARDEGSSLPNAFVVVEQVRIPSLDEPHRVMRIRHRDPSGNVHE